LVEIIKWTVVLVTPGEDELPLLAELSTRRDARIIAVLDPTGLSIGAGLAEVMGLPIIASLAELAPGSAHWLVHPPLNDIVADLVDQATAAGLEPVAAHEFSDQLSGPRLAAAPEATPEQDLDVALSGLSVAAPRTTPAGDREFLELETATIHRTLSRIEEALDREALLRWLLGLATRATGATSGSLMLLDHQSDELYVAFAYGLSEATQHRTRVRLGEAVAGRVARSRQAELVRGPQHPGADRDRVDVHSAVCAPILWDGRVLGVINVCTAAGETALDHDSLAILESLTHRFGLILERFLHIQSTGDRALLREMEERFTGDTGQPETLASTLCAWAADVRDVAGADQASLDILTADGDLFCAAPEGTSYETPPSPLKAEVFSRGRPRVLRPGEATSGHAFSNNADPTAGVNAQLNAETTVFHLPVGHDPLRALLTLTFTSAARAHHFHAVSSEILLLLNRHLTGFLDRASTSDQLDRLTTLAAALSELGVAPLGPESAERVLAAARRLTGAGEAMLLTGEEMLAPGPGETETPERALRREAARMLNDAGRSGWQTTVLEVELEGGGSNTRSLLAVPLGGHDAFPGLVLLDKRRLHPLDGASFTEFDALFARRLLPLLADRLRRRPTFDPTETDALADRLAPAKPDLTTTVITAAATRGALSGILHREMDRCDRYHTMLGLAAFRPVKGDGSQPAPDPTALVAGIERQLRSSDHIGCLEDGTVLVIVPEDIQSLPRLQRRISDMMRVLAGNPALEVRAASRVYPGGGDTPDKLLQAVLAAVS
jgi:hypothetical protein